MFAKSDKKKTNIT